MIVFRDISLDRGQTVLCGRCTPDSPPAPEYRSVADIESCLALAPGDPSGEGVLFSGADPLGYPGFERLLGTLASAGTRRIGVRTSGQHLADPQRVIALVEAGVRLFEVPFPDPSGHPHDPLTGAQAPFAAAVHGVRTVLEVAEGSDARIAVRGLLGVCRHTAQDLPASVMRLAELRVTSVALHCVGGADMPRLAEWVGAACDTGTVNRVWVSVTGLAPELLGDKALHATDVMTLAGVNE